MLVEFDPTAYTVTEGVDAFAELTLIRSGHLDETTVVTVSPLSGTAIGKYTEFVPVHFTYYTHTAGSDFSSSPTVVTFFPGETSAQVQVPITDDSILEGTEVFSATLSTAESDVVFGDDTAFVTILDNNGGY